jgi:hypothetical protein
VFSDGKEVNLTEGQAIILDIISSFIQFAVALLDTTINQHAKAIGEVKADAVKTEFLTCQLNISDKYGVFSPRCFVTILLTSIIKFIA